MSEPALTHPPEYAALIDRHLTARCGFLASEQVERILENCGLEIASGHVRARGGGTVDEESAYRYKQAIKAQLGDGAYSMTKVNFRLMGCRCKDCGSGQD